MMRETTGYPQAYNIEADPKEEVSVMHQNTWLVVPYMQLISQYKESLKKYPNPPAPSLNVIR
jgi:arylsulfatase